MKGLAEGPREPWGRPWGRTLQAEVRSRASASVLRQGPDGLVGRAAAQCGWSRDGNKREAWRGGGGHRRVRMGLDGQGEDFAFDFLKWVDYERS